MRPRSGRDLRSYARSTQARLIVGALLLVFAVGGGLIWFIFGREAAGAAAICIGAGLAPVGLIALWLAVLEWVARRGRDD